MAEHSALFVLRLQKFAGDMLHYGNWPSAALLKWRLNRVRIWEKFLWGGFVVGQHFAGKCHWPCASHLVFPLSPSTCKYPSMTHLPLDLRSYHLFGTVQTVFLLFSSFQCTKFNSSRCPLSCQVYFFGCKTIADQISSLVYWLKVLFWRHEGCMLRPLPLVLQVLDLVHLTETFVTRLTCIT